MTEEEFFLSFLAELWLHGLRVIKTDDSHHQTKLRQAMNVFNAKLDELDFNQKKGFRIYPDPFTGEITAFNEVLHTFLYELTGDSKRNSNEVTIPLTPALAEFLLSRINENKRTLVKHLTTIYFS